jgi:flagellar hook-associated protein 3 FlgL
MQMNSLIVGSALSTQSQYAQAVTQEGTGLVATDFATLGGASTTVMLNLEGNIGQAQTWASNATTVGSRTQAAYTALGNMATTVASLQTQISAALATPSNTNVPIAVNTLQQNLVSEINTQSAGVYVFGGSDTSTQPVTPASLNAYQTSGFDPSTANSSYYTGDNMALSVQVSSSQTISYGVTASNPAIEQAMRASQLVLQASQGIVYGSSSGSTITSTYPPQSDPTTALGVAGTITVGAASVTVSATDSLNSVAANINAAGAGVTATVIDSNGTYRLSLSSASAVTVADATAAVPGPGPGLGLTGSTATFAGTVKINGTAITVAAGDSVTTIANNINAAGLAGITATPLQDPTTGSWSLKLSGLTSTTTVSDTSGLGLTDYTGTMKQALTLANSAETAVANLQESVAATSSQLSSASQQQTTYVTYLQTSLSSVKDVDTAQAAANVSKYQTQLQASYMAVTAIAKLNLAQYL